MKLLIIICVIVLLLQLAVIGLGLSTGDGEKPSTDEIEDGDWDPKKKHERTSGFESLLDPFRPRLELPWKQESFQTVSPVDVTFTNGHEDRRVAKFELTGGTGVMIRYDCRARSDADRCPQITCLCPANKPIDAQAFSGCGRSGPKGNQCPADGNIGSIVVYSETGKLQFSGLSSTGGTVQQP